MQNSISKRLFQGFICLHILHHAQEEPIYGSWMLEELSKHGYKLSPGTLYPLLHNLEKDGLINHYNEKVKGKIRKYYRITEEGKMELKETKKYLIELIAELGIVEEE